MLHYFCLFFLLQGKGTWALLFVLQMRASVECASSILGEKCLVLPAVSYCFAKHQFLLLELYLPFAEPKHCEGG